MENKVKVKNIILIVLIGSNQPPRAAFKRLIIILTPNKRVLLKRMPWRMPPPHFFLCSIFPLENRAYSFSRSFFLYQFSVQCSVLSIQ